LTLISHPDRRAPDGPNPFAGPAESVMECMFFSKDLDRKIKGCTDLIADAAGDRLIRR